MARKKQEVALQQELSSTEEWDEALAKEGLWVIDVYQDWCGPCVAMAGNFRRIKNEIGDDLLKFAVAKADTVSSLEKYRGSCEPCFLFYAGGVLVAYVHGANAPLIMRTITEQLAQEHKVLDGSSERREVKDPFVTVAVEKDKAVHEGEEEEEDGSYVPHRRVSTYPGDYEEDDRRMFEYNDELVIYDDSLMPAFDEEEEEEGFTVAIIKPNVVKDGKVDEILDEMKAHGIKLLAQEERHLTEDEARQFYAHLQDEEYFEDLVKFMASGPSHVLVLTKGQSDDSIIRDWRDLLGPPRVEEAKDVAPNSLRARYGAGTFMNAVHGSDSKETAARELAFFFPSLRVPTHKKQKDGLERTVALIRPDALAQSKDEILQKISEAGFQIAMQRVVQLTKKQAEEFYSEHVDQPYFEELTTCMSSGPLLALGLARSDAIDQWRSMLGPKDVEEAKTTAPDSLRAQYSVEGSPINQLHGSDSLECAQKELNYFFPMEQTVAVIKPDAFGTKDAIIQKIHEAGFRIAARKETTITPDIAASFYEDAKDKSYYDNLVEYMTSGPTMFMVLSREGAVDGWRQEIGPTDPNVAKQDAPNSIRAQFGQDILHNAVHGCSTKEEAMAKIHKIFGQLEFNSDGTVKAPPAEPQATEEGKKDPKQPGDEGQKQPGDEGQKQPGDEGQKQPGDEGQKQPGDEGQKQPGDEGQKQPGDEGQKQPGDEGQKQEEQQQDEEKPDDQQEEIKDEQGKQQEDQPLEETKLDETQQEDNGQQAQEEASPAPNAEEHQPVTEAASEEGPPAPQEAEPEEVSPGETEAKEEAGAGDVQEEEPASTEGEAVTDQAKEETVTEQATADEGTKAGTETEDSKEEGKGETTAETPGDPGESKQEESGPTEGGET